MSGTGGPPHHPHNRPITAGNTAWNHLQVPNFYPRQPQHAHLSNEHPILHQPTWHTPTTEPLKLPHSHIINLEQMLSERPFLHQPTAPISLSVRDTNKINSLAASVLERQIGESLKPVSSPAAKTSCTSPAVNATSPAAQIATPASPIKSTSPSCPVAHTKSPTSDQQQQQQLSPKIMKKAKRVDSILERLTPQVSEGDVTEKAFTSVVLPVPSTLPQHSQSVHDENSNSSSILTVPTARDDDVVSSYSNEDSRDSNKSRRKRKPAKTKKVTKDVDVAPATAPACIPDGVEKVLPTEINIDVVPVIAGPTIEHVKGGSAPGQRRKASSPKRQDGPTTRKSRRKTSSEDETIDKIAAMVGTIVQDQHHVLDEDAPASNPTTLVNPVALQPAPTIVTLAQKKDFVAVEDKLEEMFAGLEDNKQANLTAGSQTIAVVESEVTDLTDEAPLEDGHPAKATKAKKKAPAKGKSQKKPARAKRKPKSKDETKKRKTAPNAKAATKKVRQNKKNGKAKADFSVKDLYAYDSGSNASSSKSRGPFVHISGPRDSPLSVLVVNSAQTFDEDGRKVVHKPLKRLQDEAASLRNKMRGLHSSTLSKKYDAQTRDASWICAFCKRGPYTADFSSEKVCFQAGELFGPYIVTQQCAAFGSHLDDPFDKNYKSKKIARAVDAQAPQIVQQSKRANKRKCSETIVEAPQDWSVGIVAVDDSSYEVWAHEDCLLWSPGIGLIGCTVVGIDDAIWSASNVACLRCAMKGANVCCLKRGCTNVVHVGCAHLANWHLDALNYKAYCSDHKPTM